MLSGGKMPGAGRRAEEYVVVVGGVNIDIGGWPDSPLASGESNPGVVKTSLGGVGRNIAHNLSLLGIHVKLLTALGTDMNALRVEAGCAESGVDIRHVRKVQGENTSTYLFISDTNGNAVLGISDMKICDFITPDYLEEKLDILRGAKAVVVEANIPEESIAYITGHVRVPIFADPVSVPKSKRLAPYLRHFYAMKPNAAEAAAMSGVTVTDSRSMREAARRLLADGLPRVYISNGREGVMYGDRNGFLLYPSVPAGTRNASGAGDAFMAALVYSYCRGLSQADTVRFCTATAAICVEAEDTTNLSLSEAAVYERAGML